MLIQSRRAVWIESLSTMISRRNKNSRSAFIEGRNAAKIAEVDANHHSLHRSAPAHSANQHRQSTGPRWEGAGPPVDLVRIDELRRNECSVEPADKAHGKFAPFLAAPCETLGEGIDLIVMAAGKSE
jgi:hypothetical protein